MARATLLFHYKARQGGLVLEMVLWQMPEPSRDRPHGLEHRFHLGRQGESLVRYDNEAGKGDHRHAGPDQIEEPYAFSTLEQLIEEFRDECERLGWRWEE